jgi:hypothetical protein
MALVLEPREAHLPAYADTMARVRPVLQRSSERVQARAIGLLGVLRPPGRDLVLGAVPFAAQFEQAPGDPDILTRRATAQPLLDQGKAPVNAKRLAPVCEASLPRWRGVGSNANRYAW